MMLKAISSYLKPAIVLAFLATGCAENRSGVDRSTNYSINQAPENKGTQENSGTNQSDVATIRILLTDGPADYIEAAEVDIGAVELISTEGKHVTVTADGSDGFVNLLDFQNGATKPIAEATIDPGEFSQMRLVVESARVKLKAPYTFRDGSTQKDLKIPSGAQTGIKLNLQNESADGPLSIVPGETVLVLDFDVSQSFVLRGNPDTPAGMHGVIFKPAIRVTGTDVAASIAGTVSTALGESVEGLLVRAIPKNEGSAPGYQIQSGTAVTDASGNYKIHYLVPGDYEVMVVDLPASRGTEPEFISLTLDHKENETGVNFEIIDITGSIAGTISTPDDYSAEGIHVTITPNDPALEPITLLTNAAGEYYLDEVLPGDYIVTIELAEGFISEPPLHAVTVEKQQEVMGVDFEVIDVRGSLTGTVTKDTEDPELEEVSVEGIVVTAELVGGDLITVETDAEGKYLFEKLLAGIYTITIELDDGLSSNPPQHDVDLGLSEDLEEIDFEIVKSEEDP